MGVIAFLIRMLYGLCSLAPQRDEIVFVSRQSPRPFDFSLLEPSLRERFPGYTLHWECVSKIGKMDPFLMVRQIWHVARSRVCLVDGYVPAVSIPKRHRALVVQVWHAPGAVKKFGYQSLDTPAGRTRRQAEALRMHRGYDYVIAGLPGAIPTFSEAFDVPAERIVALGLPRGDYLMSPDFASRREKKGASIRKRLGITCDEGGASGPIVLYAPTFRKGVSDPAWMRGAVCDLSRALGPIGAHLVVAGHPLDVKEVVPGDHDEATYLSGSSTIDALEIADYVVTDYSTVVFEAGFARKPVLFYTPDIEEYRLSPGLNIDPLDVLPTLTFTSADGIAAVVSGLEPYDEGAFADFIDSQMGDIGVGSIGRITDFIVDHLEQGE